MNEAIKINISFDYFFDLKDYKLKTIICKYWFSDDKEWCKKYKKNCTCSGQFRQCDYKKRK